MPANNLSGNNQHGGRVSYPEDWPEILQGYRRRGLQKKEMHLELVNNYCLSISDRTLQTQLSLHTESVRKPQKSKEDTGVKLLETLGNDPHRRLGARRLKEKLASEDHHVSREWIGQFLKILEPQTVAARKPGAKQIHRHGLHSLGPNEEWSVDGHDKVMNSMGIGIWGVVDKFSRNPIAFFALPNNRLADVVLACYLLTVQKAGGIPIRVAADKGSETGKAHAAQVTLRQRYAPDLDSNELPAFVHVKSVYNITVERQWQPLFKDILANILVFWLNHKGVYHSEDPLHQGLAKSIWARVVQNALDEHKRFHAENHKIRSQPKRLLPSGGRAGQFYDYPEQYGGVQCLIPVPPEDIALLIETYVPHNIFHFCSDELHYATVDALVQLGNPPVTQETAWSTFAQVLAIVRPMGTTEA